MIKSFKAFFAAVLFFALSTSMLSAQMQKAIPLGVKVGGGYTSVYFDGVWYNVVTSEDYYFDFEEYDSEWVRLNIIPCKEEVQSYTPIYVQWGTFAPVVLTFGPDGGGSYLLGSETGYAEK